MTVHDENDEVAKIIKDLEDRISDLEEDNEGESTPQLIRTQYDEITVNDIIEQNREITIESARWGDSETGWDISSWS